MRGSIETYLVYSVYVMCFLTILINFLEVLVQDECLTIQHNRMKEVVERMFAWGNTGESQFRASQKDNYFRLVMRILLAIMMGLFARLIFIDVGSYSLTMFRIYIVMCNIVACVWIHSGIKGLAYVIENHKRLTATE